ncbi:MAG: DUF951 domain-containing protein [Erysipelotrichaceae bacterium]|nr:DUF951 domain-containing protein [Erysipelotrichaceae bacterium]
MTVVKIDLYDVVEMKKAHPCVHRSKIFQVVRVGADIKIQCQGCGNVIMMERIKFNRRYKKTINPASERLFKK